MANIPVERTSTGIPPWLWLVGLLLLGLLGWFLFAAADDDDVDVVADETVYVEDDVAAADPVVAGAMDPVVATALDMSNLYVTRVTGDRTFFVAPSESMSDQETLVILDQTASPSAPGIEGQVDINPGQQIAITGEMGTLGDTDLANMGIPDADLNTMTAESQVIRADGTSIEILNAEMPVGAVEVDE